eukprot:scaffold200708_cov32-Tisochrysis_lutea.AAC.5
MGASTGQRGWRASAQSCTAVAASRGESREQRDRERERYSYGAERRPTMEEREEIDERRRKEGMSE